MSNFLRPTGNVYRILWRAAVVVAGGLALSSCGGSKGYGASIEPCKPGDNTGVEATMNTNDSNDPIKILQFAVDRNNKDGEANYRDGSSVRRRGLSNPDLLNGLGEVVCTPGEEADPEHLVFTPSGLEARQAYLDENSQSNSQD